MISIIAIIIVLIGAAGLIYEVLKRDKVSLALVNSDNEEAKKVELDSLSDKNVTIVSETKTVDTVYKP